MIGIIDYGMGNLRSVQKAFAKGGISAELVDCPEKILSYSGVVLPGVGAFGQAMDNLSKSGMKQSILKLIGRKTPFLGICLGLQLLFDSSEEAFGESDVPGLGIIPGKVKRFPVGLKVPQIGWNQLVMEKESPLLKGFPPNAYVYFVHSYYVAPTDSEVNLTTSEYGLSFVSSIWQDNVYAIQFHPEKSSRLGLKILENFGEIVNENITRN